VSVDHDVVAHRRPRGLRLDRERHYQEQSGHSALSHTKGARYI